MFVSDIGSWNEVVLGHFINPLDAVNVMDVSSQVTSADVAMVLPSSIDVPATVGAVLGVNTFVTMASINTITPTKAQIIEIAHSMLTIIYL